MNHRIGACSIPLCYFAARLSQQHEVEEEEEQEQEGGRSRSEHSIRAGQEHVHFIKEFGGCH